MKNFSISFLITGIILSVVYKKSHDESAGPRYIKQLYEISSDTIAIDTNSYFLEPFLCRSIARGTSGGASGNIMALIYLVNAGDQRIPTNIFIRNLYVVNKNDVWTSTSSSQATPEFMLTKVSTEMPTWEDTDFDVIAEVTDTLTQRTYYVISRNQRFSDI